MKNILYAWVSSFLVGHANFVLAINVQDTKQTTTGDNITDGDFITTLDNILGYIVGLLYFIAVVFALWGWFQILTAGWDEEKVKKGKTTLIQAAVGLIVIFLASSIISWIINIFADGGWAVA